MTGLRFLATLILLLSAGSSVAQDPGTPSVESIAAEGTVAGETSAGEEMPEALRSPAIDFFASGLTLHAHRLRGLKAEVAGLLLGSPGGGEIAFEALATPLRGDGGKANVPLFVEIDGPTFLAANQRSTARFEVYAYALGAGGQVVSYLAEAFAIDVRKLGEAVWQSGLKYFGHLELPAGEYRLRILIRNYHSGSAALREVALTVPAFDQPFVFPIFQPPSARDAWLAVREWQGPAEYPLWIEERAVSPAVRPVLVAGRRSEAHVLAYGLPGSAAQGRIELLAAGVSRESTATGEDPAAEQSPVATATLEAVRQPGADGGLETIAVAFEAPQVSPGSYALRVVLNGTTSASVPVLVLQEGTRDRALMWTDLRRQLGGAGIAVREQPAAATAQSPREKERPAKREQRLIRKLADGYRQALALLGTDQGSAARSALLELESSVLTEGTLEMLTPAQLAVAKQLSDQDVESLLPVLALHDELYSVYRQRSLYSLGFHAREVIEALAELYAERGGTQGSQIVAARVLASLGGYLQAANLPSSSRRLYRRALGHDPQNLAALIGLASSYERYGDYSRAITALEDLAVAHPSSGEGLLRLAINLDRLGVRARARTLTERVIELEAPSWVRSLAYQKLARILVETGNLDRAAELLEASLEDIPGQHGSIYLLAHVYDRQKRPYRSLELLDGVAASQNPSPRKIYDSWPETSLDAVRRELSEAAAVRVALVAEILGPSAEAP